MTFAGYESPLAPDLPYCGQKSRGSPGMDEYSDKPPTAAAGPEELRNQKNPPQILSFQTGTTPEYGSSDEPEVSPAN